MWRAGGELFKELLWGRLLGWGTLVGVLLGLALREVLQGATGLVGRNDTGQIELWDASVAWPDDLAQVRPIPDGHGCERVRGVRLALVGHPLAEQMELLLWKNVFVGLRELRGHATDGGVHGSMGGMLHAREAAHLVLRVHGGDIAGPHSVWGSSTHHGRVHARQPHGVGRSEEHTSELQSR